MLSLVCIRYCLKSMVKNRPLPLPQGYSPPHFTISYYLILVTIPLLNFLHCNSGMSQVYTYLWTYLFYLYLWTISDFFCYSSIINMITMMCDK